MSREGPAAIRLAQALADDLDRYIRSEPIAARRVGVIDRLWLWSKRNPRLAAALGSTAALVLLAVFALLYVDRQWKLAVAAEKAAALVRDKELMTQAIYDNTMTRVQRSWESQDHRQFLELMNSVALESLKPPIAADSSGTTGGEMNSGRLESWAPPEGQFDNREPWIEHASGLALNAAGTVLASLHTRPAGPDQETNAAQRADLVGRLQSKKIGTVLEAHALGGDGISSDRARVCP